MGQIAVRIIFWSPDSKWFLVNGGANAYAGFFVTVYSVSASGVHKLHVTESAQADMVKTFPPCKALNRDDGICSGIVRHPGFNMSGLAWVSGSSAIVVIAEVPCSSAYGGIMCQVLGYQLDVPGGRIGKHMTATDLKQTWQRSMAWDMHIPEPPQYEPAQAAQ